MKSAFVAALPSTACALLGALLFSSCSSATATGTGIGAVLGGGLGALTTRSKEGALVGAGIGAGVGALVGNAADRRAQDHYPASYGQGDIDQSPPAPQPQAPQHPWAQQRSPGVATSPYPPHRDIDVRGFQRGDAVVDPTTGGVFLVP